MNKIDLNTCPLLTNADLETLVRMPSIVRRALKAGWIRPVNPTGHYLFRRRDVDALIARIESGELPPMGKRDSL